MTPKQEHVQSLVRLLKSSLDARWKVDAIQKLARTGLDGIAARGILIEHIEHENERVRTASVATLFALQRAGVEVAKATAETLRNAGRALPRTAFALEHFFEPTPSGP